MTKILTYIMTLLPIIAIICYIFIYQNNKSNINNNDIDETNISDDQQDLNWWWDVDASPNLDATFLQHYDELVSAEMIPGDVDPNACVPVSTRYVFDVYQANLPRWKNDRFMVIYGEMDFFFVIPCKMNYSVYSLPKDFPVPECDGTVRDPEDGERISFGKYILKRFFMPYWTKQEETKAKYGITWICDHGYFTLNKRNDGSVIKLDDYHYYDYEDNQLREKGKEVVKTIQEQDILTIDNVAYYLQPLPDEKMYTEDYIRVMKDTYKVTLMFYNYRQWCKAIVHNSSYTVYIDYYSSNGSFDQDAYSFLLGLCKIADYSEGIAGPSFSANNYIFDDTIRFDILVIQDSSGKDVIRYETIIDNLIAVNSIQGKFNIDEKYSRMNCRSYYGPVTIDDCLHSILLDVYYNRSDLCEYQSDIGFIDATYVDPNTGDIALKWCGRVDFSLFMHQPIDEYDTISTGFICELHSLLKSLQQADCINGHVSVNKQYGLYDFIGTDQNGKYIEKQYDYGIPRAKYMVIDTEENMYVRDMCYYSSTKKDYLWKADPIFECSSSSFGSFTNIDSKCTADILVINDVPTAKQVIFVTKRTDPSLIYKPDGGKYVLIFQNCVAYDESAIDKQDYCAQYEFVQQIINDTRSLEHQEISNWTGKYKRYTRHHGEIILQHNDGSPINRFDYNTFYDDQHQIWVRTDN